MKPETAEALRLVASGKSMYMAAKMVGIAQSTVARALAKEQCPTCGQTIKQHRRKDHE